MSDNYPVLGSADSNNQAWNALLAEIRGGYEGLERLANHVLDQLDTQDWVDEYRDDLIQDGICEVFRSVGAWDQSRKPGPWAKVVMRNKMLRSLSTEYRRLDAPTDPLGMAEEYDRPEPGFDAVARDDLIERLREDASAGDRAVIDKVLSDEPLTKTEQKRWQRYRQRFQGVA